MSAGALWLPRSRGQGPRTPWGAYLPDPAFSPPSSARTFTSKPERFRGRKATAFCCWCLSLWRRRAVLLVPVVPVTSLLSGHCSGSRPHPRLAGTLWQGGRGDTWAAEHLAVDTTEDDDSRENFMFESDALFPQSLESKCWTLLLFRLWEENRKFSFLILFLKFGVRCQHVPCHHGTPGPANGQRAGLTPGGAACGASCVSRGGGVVCFIVKPRVILVTKLDGVCLPSLCLFGVSVPPRWLAEPQPGGGVEGGTPRLWFPPWRAAGLPSPPLVHLCRNKVYLLDVRLPLPRGPWSHRPGAVCRLLSLLVVRQTQNIKMCALIKGRIRRCPGLWVPILVRLGCCKKIP